MSKKPVKNTPKGTNKKPKNKPKNKPILSTDKTGFVTWFRHWRSGKIIKAADYGYKAFPFGGVKK